MEKARGLFEKLEKQNYEKPDTSLSVDTFVPRQGWFEKFKIRANIHNIKISGEASSADVSTAKEFTKSLNSLIVETKISPEKESYQNTKSKDDEIIQQSRKLTKHFTRKFRNNFPSFKNSNRQ